MYTDDFSVKQYMTDTYRRKCKDCVENGSDLMSQPEMDASWDLILMRKSDEKHPDVKEWMRAVEMYMQMKWHRFQETSVSIKDLGGAVPYSVLIDAADNEWWAEMILSKDPAWECRLGKAWCKNPSWQDETEADFFNQNANPEFALQDNVGDKAAGGNFLFHPSDMAKGGAGQDAKDGFESDYESDDEMKAKAIQGPSWASRVAKENPHAHNAAWWRSVGAALADYGMERGYKMMKPEKELEFFKNNGEEAFKLHFDERFSEVSYKVHSHIKNGQYKNDVKKVMMDAGGEDKTDGGKYSGIPKHIGARVDLLHLCPADPQKEAQLCTNVTKTVLDPSKQSNMMDFESKWNQNYAEHSAERRMVEDKFISKITFSKKWLIGFGCIFVVNFNIENWIKFVILIFN